MRARLWVVSLLAGASFAALGVTPAPVPPPEPQVALPSPLAQRRALVDALIVEDFQALVEATGGGDELERMAESRRRDAERMQEPGYEPSTPEAQLDVVIAKLLTEDGVDALVAEWQPLLAEQANAKVLEFNLGLAALLNSLDDDTSASAEDIRQRGQLILAVQAWANGVDFNDPARLRRAVRAAAEFVRRSGARSSADFVTMPFEDLVIHLDAALGAVKDVLAAYDLDADVVLRSITMTELWRDRDRARIRTEIKILGVPMAFEEELRWRDDEWRDAEVVDQMERWERENPSAPEASEPEAAEPAIAAPPDGEQAPADADSADAGKRAAVPSCEAPADQQETPSELTDA